MHWLRIVIYSSVVVASVFTFAAAEIWPGDADLWQNLFAEAIGVAFTVVVVENLIKIANQRRSKPARYAAFKETMLVYTRLTSLWFQMVRSSLDPARHADLLTEPGIRLFDTRFGEVVMRLNLDQEAPVLPKCDWRVFLKHQIEEIERGIDRCLQRYSAFMEPELIQSLQDLERTSFFAYGKMQTALPRIGKELGVRRTPYFGWGKGSSAEELLAPLDRLAQLLAQHRAEFHGMPGIPDAIDLDHLARLDALRKSAAETAAADRGDRPDLVSPGA